MTELDIRSLYFVSLEGCSRPSTIGAFKSDSSKGVLSGCCADVKRGSEASHAKKRGAEEIGVTRQG
jgi:hypothetical protein